MPIVSTCRSGKLTVIWKCIDLKIARKTPFLKETEFFYAIKTDAPHPLPPLNQGREKSSLLSLAPDWGEGGVDLRMS